MSAATFLPSHLISLHVPRDGSRTERGRNPAYPPARLQSTHEIPQLRHAPPHCLGRSSNLQTKPANCLSILREVPSKEDLQCPEQQERHLTTLGGAPVALATNRLGGGA